MGKKDIVHGVQQGDETMAIVVLDLDEASPALSLVMFVPSTLLFMLSSSRSLVHRKSENGAIVGLRPTYPRPPPTLSSFFRDCARMIRVGI